MDEQEQLEDKFDDIGAGIELAAICIIADGIAKVTGKTSRVEVFGSAAAAERKYVQTLAKGRKRLYETIQGTFEDIAHSVDNEAAHAFEHQGIEQVTVESNAATGAILERSVESAKRDVRQFTETSVLGVTNGKRTIPFRDAYIEAVNDAVTAIKVGDKAAQAIIDQTVRNLANSGLRVVYASGRMQSLRSALQMSISDAARLEHQELEDEVGREYGADGVEITAHAMCAPDHIDIQGKQFGLDEWDDINRSLDRPIGTMNCKHQTRPVLLGVSPRKSRELLDMYRRESMCKVTFTGLDGRERTMTKYEASQYQRSVERSIRSKNERAVLQGRAGVDNSATLAKVKSQTAQYRSICNEAGLKPRINRTEAVL